MNDEDLDKHCPTCRCNETPLPQSSASDPLVKLLKRARNALREADPGTPELITEINRALRNPAKARAAATMSVDALYETARCLSDRGSDFGWNPYYKGNRIPPATLHAMAKKDEDQNILHWYQAFRYAIDQYETATGKEWNY